MANPSPEDLGLLASFDDGEDFDRDLETLGRLGEAPAAPVAPVAAPVLASPAFVDVSTQNKPATGGIRQMFTEKATEAAPLSQQFSPQVDFGGATGPAVGTPDVGAAFAPQEKLENLSTAADAQGVVPIGTNPDPSGVVPIGTRPDPSGLVPAAGDPAQGVASILRAESLGRLQQGPRTVRIPERPAGFVNQGQVIERGPEIDPATLEAVERGAQAQAGLEIARGEAIQAQAADQAAQFQQAAQEAKVEAAELRQREEQHKRAVDRQMDVVRQRTRALENQEIDPDRFWAQRGGGARMAAAVLSAISTAIAHIQGGEPVAADMIREAVEDDIDAQKAEREFSLQELDAEVNLLSQLQSEGMSPEAAEAATRALLFESAAQEARAQAAEMAGTEAGQAALVQAQAIQNEAAKWKAQAEQMTGDHLRISQAFDPGQKGGVARVGGTTLENEIGRIAKALGVSRREAAALLGTDVLPSEGAQELSPEAKLKVRGLQVRDPATGELLGYGLGEKDKTEATEALVLHRKITDVINRATPLMESTDLSPERVKEKTDELANLGGELLGLKNQLSKFGAMDNGTQGLLQMMTGDLGALVRNKGARTKLKAVQRTIDDGLNADLRARVTADPPLGAQVGGQAFQPPEQQLNAEPVE